MKKICVLLVFTFLLCPILNSQEILPRNKQLGLTGLPVIYLNSGLNARGFALYANGGWFISDKISLGARPFFGRVNFGGSPSQEINALGFNFYFRFYFGEGKVMPFFDVNAGVGRLWYTSDNPFFQEQIGEVNGAMFNFAFGPGIDIPIGNNYAIEIVVQYLRMRNISFPEETTIGNTLIPSIGVQRFF